MSDATAPVTESAEDRTLEDGIGIALSGGGYRATLFHAGGFLRLMETGLLKQASRISSVSGGSITSAKVALEWGNLTNRAAFLKHVVDPVRRLTSKTIDVPSVITGLLLPGSVADRVAAEYREYLFGDATLQDLPDEPRFIINATNVETGSLWRFSKPYMRDWQVGRVDHPTVSLADAVTASSAFPPVLSPYVLRIGPDDFTHVETGVGDEMLEDITLTDGGVYDNLGLETVYKRYKTLLVADAGGALAPDGSPPGDWARHAKRVLDIIHGQVSSVRIRQLIHAYRSGERKGAYWGIRTDIARYGLPDALPAPFDRTTALALTATRLKRLPNDVQERLINWGYAACDASVRANYQSLSPAPSLPYPASGI